MVNDKYSSSVLKCPNCETPVEYRTGYYYCPNCHVRLSSASSEDNKVSRPSNLWCLMPLFCVILDTFFGIFFSGVSFYFFGNWWSFNFFGVICLFFGCIIGYMKVKGRNKGMAKGLLVAEIILVAWAIVIIIVQLMGYYFHSGQLLRLFTSFIVGLIATITVFVFKRRKSDQLLQPVTLRVQQTPKEQLNSELEQSKQRLVNFIAAHENGKISGDVFVATSKKLEAKIASLEKMKANDDYSSFSNQFYYDAYMSQHVTKKLGGWWYLVPLSCGLLGGIVGYVAVKDRGEGMAKNILGVGILVFIMQFIFGLLFVLPLLF
jgi:uncharacterized membrane protein